MKPTLLAKTASVKMPCGCTHIITSALGFKRRGLCDQHRNEKRLRENVDAVTLEGHSYKYPSPLRTGDNACPPPF